MLKYARQQYEAEANKGIKTLEKEQSICDKAQKDYYSKSVEMLKAQDIVAKGMQDDMTKKQFEKVLCWNVDGETNLVSSKLN